ncbi:MAG: hypothetical protein GWN99_10880 [Gemmatimonadetes bacterium]|uniref:Yip1 domain-containing protein n=1 Tax=Candidatus Kutchimonas denitrificans TaxID=3056748 RepID=A0AAE4Z8J2_9BACT|nr:hypothetical protein [Gemmatimonadota bacterium]NIR74968.1 hypothetical protein [Candidatus Kutchimonas denitrificans]NIS01551.1 hypothetical protein [Gemmatimonadota bacterium]NIT67289.1 hypothetical protein [Gemmatimonadota bacterium]NIU52652.1 hypothetical protein [Gemmatimonadota bacterium]
MNMEGQPYETGQAPERGAGPPDSGAATPEPGLVQRVLLVFMSPTKLGEILRGRQPWFWTLAIVAVVSVVLFFLVPSDIFLETMREQAARRPQGQEFDPESALRMGRILGSIGWLLGTFIAAAVVAGVVYLVFNVMFGGDLTYKQHLSAVSHMYWINMLGLILLVPLWIAQEDMQVRLGLGLLLPDEPSSYFGHVLNSINLFGVWSAAALGAMESGLSGGRISLGKGIWTVLALYLLWALISAVWPTITGGVMG